MPISARVLYLHVRNNTCPLTFVPDYPVAHLPGIPWAGGHALETLRYALWLRTGFGSETLDRDIGSTPEPEVDPNSVTSMLYCLRFSLLVSSMSWPDYMCRNNTAGEGLDPTYNEWRAVLDPRATKIVWAAEHLWFPHMPHATEYELDEEITPYIRAWPLFTTAEKKTLQA